MRPSVSALIPSSPSDTFIASENDVPLHAFAADSPSRQVVQL